MFFVLLLPTPTNFKENKMKKNTLNIALAIALYGLALSANAADLVIGDGLYQTYSLSGTGSVTADPFETIGTGGGYGVFNQSGGTNTVTNGSLSIGFSYNSRNSTGVYNLSGGSLNVANESIGLNNSNSASTGAGYGTFNQTGGNHTVSNSLYIGSGVGNKNKGSYFLSNGTLSAVFEAIGAGGVGTFTQSGGTHTVSDWLQVGDSTGVGTYTLTGGSLINNGRVGTVVGAYGNSLNPGEVAGSGAFIQTGGTFQTSFLSVGNGLIGQGSYSLSGNGVLNTSYEIIGLSGTGTFSQLGGTHTINGDLVLGEANTQIYTNFQYGLFSTTLSNGSFVLSGGSLTATNEFLAKGGNGTFTQTNGTHTINNNLYVGYSSGNGSRPLGSYNLSGGTLTVANEYIGHYSGNGIFTQSGGTHTITNDLTMGTHFTGTTVHGQGTYNLNGGVLNVGRIVNGAGNSTFNLDGGTLNLTGNSVDVDTLNIGNTRVSSFILDSGKTINATNLNVGGFGSLAVNGVFNGNALVDGGVLKGTGVINGNVAVGSGAFLQPGNSPGLLTINGDLHLLSGSILELQVYKDAAGNANYDQLVLGGSYLFDAGSVIRFDFGNSGFSGDSFIAESEGAMPKFSMNDFFKNKDGSAINYLSFENVLISGLVTTSNMSLSRLSSNGDLIATPVPEPETYCLMLAGLGLMGFIARRRKNYYA